MTTLRNQPSWVGGTGYKIKTPSRHSIEMENHRKAKENENTSYEYANELGMEHVEGLLSVGILGFVLICTATISGLQGFFVLC